MLNITTEIETTDNITVITHTFTGEHSAFDQCILDCIYHGSTLTRLMVQRPDERFIIYKEDLEAKFAEHYAEFVNRYA